MNLRTLKYFVAIADAGSLTAAAATIPLAQPALTRQLRELEADGLVTRTVFAEVPPRVEYAITDKALGLGPTMQALAAWWNEYGRDVPVKSPTRGRQPKTVGTGKK